MRHVTVGGATPSPRRWLTHEVAIATKLGARPTRLGINFADRMAADEGLSGAAIRVPARPSRCSGAIP